MSNEFKVIDTNTGEDVTDAKSWLIGPEGKLHYYDDDDPYDRWLYEADAHYQVRRSDKAILAELIEAASPFTCNDVVDETCGTIPLMDRLELAIAEGRKLI